MQTIRAFTADASRFATKLRHVDIHKHWLRKEALNKRINVQWTSTTTILADGLTKSLPPQRHKEFVRLLGLQRSRQQGQDGEPHEDEGSTKGVCQKAGTVAGT